MISSFVHQSLSEKGSTLKGKNLLLMGADSFCFGVDPFSEGSINNSGRVVSLESVSIPGNFLQVNSTTY